MSSENLAAPVNNCDACKGMASISIVLLEALRSIVPFSPTSSDSNLRRFAARAAASSKNESPFDVF